MDSHISPDGKTMPPTRTPIEEIRFNWTPDDEWTTESEIELAAYAERLRETLQQILCIPATPFPDPAAHSLDAYARAIHSAYCQIRFKAMDALKPPKDDV